MTVSTQKFLVAAVAAIPVPLVLFFLQPDKSLAGTSQHARLVPLEIQVKIRFP